MKIYIHDLAFGGEGVGKIKSEQGGFAVFVKGALPGDTVEAKLIKIKKNYAEGALQKILKPSPERIAPRCKHFGVCGGCTLQFLNYADQLKWKQKIVSTALEKTGGFRDAPIDPIIGCVNPWFYRNKMEYGFGPGGIIGLHPAKKYAEIFDLEECFLQSDLSVEIALAVEAWAAKTGSFRNLVVRHGKNTDETMVNLIINGDDFDNAKDFAALISENFPAVTSLYWTSVKVKKGFKTMIEEHHLAGKKTLTENLTVKTDEGPFTLVFEILPQAFFQTNTRQAQVLYEQILKFAAADGEKSVLDLFCGTGTIGMFFARKGCRVTGVELNSSAVENATQNAQINNIKNIQFKCEDIGKFLAVSNEKFDILITDPPRAGIAPKSLEKILEKRIPAWIYVSCNPITLARDLKEICAAGYKLKKIQPVDMFPQTYHIEIVCLLTKVS